MDAVFEVWKAVQAGGPAVILLLLLALWWLNEDRKTIREARDRLQAQKDELNDRTLAALNSLTNVLIRGAEKSR
jgi:hypothetical protein